MGRGGVQGCGGGGGGGGGGVVRGGGRAGGGGAGGVWRERRGGGGRGGGVRGVGGGGREATGADGVDDMGLGKGSLQRREGGRVISNSIADGGSDLVARGVRYADIQDGVAVAASQLDRPIHGLEHVGLDQLALPQDTDAGAVPLQQVAVLRELRELDFGHVHERVDFVFRPLEVLNAEGVDGHYFHAAFVAHF